MALLTTGIVGRAVINDLDPAVYAFWRAVVDDTENFLRKLSDVPVTLAEWDRQKAVYKSAPQDDFLALGFATFFLNRTNRSGSLNAGPIGGRRQKGQWTLAARYNRVELQRRVEEIGRRSAQISVTKEDGVHVIEEYATSDNTLIFADPPYFQRSGSLYLNAFAAADHEALAKCLNRLAGSMWVLTYDDVPQVTVHYRDRRRFEYGVGYSAHRVAAASEIMVLSDAITNPPAETLGSRRG